MRPSVPALLVSAALLAPLAACGGGNGSNDAGPDTFDATPDADVADVPDGSADTAGVDGSGDSADAGPQPVVFVAGQATLTVDPSTLTLGVEYGAEPVVTFGPDAFQLGVVRSLDPGKSYDPSGFFIQSPVFVTPALDHWATVAAMTVDESGATLSFDDGRTARLGITTDADGRFAFQLRPEPAEGGVVAYLRVRATIDEDENFYGLGEWFDTAAHRGAIRPMQLEVDEMEGAANEAHVPVPFVTGTGGWGLFVASYRPGVFDVAATDPDRLDAVFGTAETSETDGLSFHVFAAAHPLDVTRHYYEITGDPAIPARWALGPLVWRDENDNEAQFRGDVEAIRDLDLATTGMWIDRPYATAVGAFDWKASQWDDAPAMIADARALGIRVGLWNVPYIEEGPEETADLVAEAEANGYYPPRSGLLLNHWGRMVDLTNPDAVAWWQGLVQRYIDDGIEGFKLDYGEDVVVGPFGGRVAWEFADGSTDLTMHARLQPLYHNLYAELLADDGGFLLCRGGTWGDQVNVSIIWPGDLSADFTLHREVVEDGDGEYVSVGGLPAAMIGGLSLGPSGFPLYGSDTGGYRHSPPDKETFTRWFEITALSPVMQVGTSSNDVAWEPTEANGFDAEMLEWYRFYTRLHLRLWAYTWTYLQRIRDDGRAIQRPIGFAYPEDGVHRDDEFLLGDHLLVAPVVERGQREREVYFPTGDWVDWWTGERFDGPMTATVDAPLDHLPLYVEAGAVIPLLRDTIDAMAPVADTGRVDSYATTPGVLTVRATRGPDHTFRLFDGAVVGQAEADGGASRLSFAAGDEFTAGARFELAGVPGTALSVTRGGVAVARNDALAEWTPETEGWTWIEDAGGTVVVQVLGADVEVVVLDGAE